MKREIRRYFDPETGRKTEIEIEPADFGRGYYETKYVLDGNIRRIVNTEFVESPEYVDRQIGGNEMADNSDFGYHCAGHRHRTSQERNECPMFLSKISTTRTLGTHSFRTPLSPYDHGGPGGTGSVEVIPYREGGYNTTTQVGTTTAVHHEPVLFIYPNPIMISTGCITCDELLLPQRVISDQLAYERWYKHYVEAQARCDTDFAVIHLEFIMNHMINRVTPETVLPPLPVKQIKHDEVTVKVKKDSWLANRSSMFTVNICLGLIFAAATWVISVGIGAALKGMIVSNLTFAPVCIAALVTAATAGTIFFVREDNRDRKEFPRV